jgi:hypothetical protein
VIGTVCWLLLLAGGLGIELVARLGRTNAATLVRTCDLIAVRVFGRLMLLLFWAFVGVHLFTRYTLPGH